MQFLKNESVEKHIPEPDTVVLHFNKRDSQIARDWSKSDAKDIFDDKN